MNNSLEDAIMKIAKDRSVSCAKNGKLTIEDEPWNFRLLKPQSKVGNRNNSEIILPHINKQYDMQNDEIDEYELFERTNNKNKQKKLSRIINTKGSNGSNHRINSINAYSASQQASYREKLITNESNATDQSSQNNYYFQIQNKITDLTNKIQKFKDINKEHHLLKQSSAIEVLGKKSPSYNINQQNYSDPAKRIYIQPEVIQNSKVSISYLPRIQKVYSQHMNFALDSIKKMHGDSIKIENQQNHKNNLNTQSQNEDSLNFSFSNQQQQQNMNQYTDSQKQSETNSVVISGSQTQQQSIQKQGQPANQDNILNELNSDKKQSKINKDIKVESKNDSRESTPQQKFIITPTIELEREIRSELDKSISVDIQLKNQIKYYGEVREYTSFLSKFFRYCLEVLYYGKIKARNDLPQINLTDQVRKIFLDYFEFKLEQLKMPQEDMASFKDVFHQEWSRVIDKQTLIEEVGGSAKSVRIGRDVMMRLGKFYNITNVEQYLQEAGVIFSKVLMSEHDEQVEQIDEIMTTVLFKNVVQKINQSQFFVCKRLIWESIFLDTQINWETKVRILEKMEKLRYIYFRDLYGMDVINDMEFAKSLVQYFKVKKPMLQYFKSPTKAMATEFALLLVKTMFGFKTIKQLIDYLRQVQGKNYDEQFFCMLEYCFKEALKKYGINQSVFSEVSNKFYWIRIKSGVRNDFGWIFNVIDKLIDEVNSWILRMLKIQQFKSSLKEQQLCDTVFLQFFLYTALGNAFSVHDVLPAMQYFNVKSDVMQVWLKGIKRIMLVNLKMKAGDVIEFEMYMKRCFVDISTN